MALLKGNAVIGQSGGPTVVINSSLVGVIEGLKAANFKGKILGAKNAVDGCMAGNFFDLKKVSQPNLNLLAGTPSSALGSSRRKPSPEDLKQLAATFKKNDVRYFFYIGGNDSSDTCRIVSEAAAAMNYDMVAYHCPKTIDNDLVCNDHTPGFASAAKFVAQAFIGDELDNKALPGIKINVIMGRHAGFLTAASVLGRATPENGPHLVYVPEVAFSIEKFLADVDAVYKKLGRCVIAVSEGITLADGTPVAVKLAETQGTAVERDAHGNVQLSGSGALADALAAEIKTKLKIKRVRADTFGYLQRSFSGLVSKVDAAEARASGKLAAKMALAGKFSTGSITINRAPGKIYKAVYGRVELKDIAAKTKHLPTEWITKEGNQITDGFVKYAKPLVGELPKIYQFKF